MSGRLKELPSQTAGPYVHIGATPNWADIKGVYPSDLGTAPPPPEVKGERIVLTGRIIDGSNAPMTEAVVEIWQADADGVYPGRGDARPKANTAFRGWARRPTDGTSGIFRFETIKPGSAPYPDGRPMAPHVTFWIVSRGINVGLHTRLYFGDEAAANDADPVLQLIAPRERVTTLIAPRSDVGGVPTYTFDIHLQGDKETVFFDI
jgi:protocatechuate 3,4-dioxygenase, alpha subunit